MKIRILCGMIFSAALMALFGCGGGGGDVTPVTPAATPTVVSGVAAKGQFTIGKVNVFGVDSVTSGKGTLLKTTSLDALGAYTADIGSYTGPVLIEVSGSYKDEATGTTVVLDPATPLRVVISNAAGDVKAMVTPMTELAVKKLNNVFTKTAVDTINANIAKAFNLDGITTTIPIDATIAAPANATLAQKKQSLVLATVSQMVKNSGNTLDKVLTDMAADITGSTLADKSTAAFKTAMFDFVDSTNNKTDTTKANIGTSPVNIGAFKLAHLKISTAGLVAPAKIGGIDFTFSLPAGVTLSKDAITNQVSSGIVIVSGVAAAAGTTSISLSTINAQVLRTVLANASVSGGFGAGEFINISCTIPAGNGANDASFTTAINSATVFATDDLTGAQIPGITLTAVVNVF
jgi:hypothetical protein